MLKKTYLSYGSTPQSDFAVAAIFARSRTDRSVSHRVESPTFTR